MNQLCNFIAVSRGSKPKWRCKRCGHVTPLGFAKAPYRYCESRRAISGRKKFAASACIHYTKEPVAVIKGQFLACGCSSVVLHECSLFDELVSRTQIQWGGVERDGVTKQDVIEAVTDTIKECQPRYLGRSCDNCCEFTTQNDQSDAGPRRG